MMDEVFLYVYRLPEKLSNGFCFGSGNPITFLNVDWFNTTVSKEETITFIKKKNYYGPEHSYLVLGDHPDWVFVIEAEND